MRKALFLVLGVIAIAAQAPSDPVMTNYRAYRAAVEAGDVAAAETAGRAAWEASTARDPSGSRTGVLALNLAKAALANGHRNAAYLPAQQAFTLATGGQTAGLDPVLTRLVLGRAELSRDEGREGVARLTVALDEAQGHDALGADAYEAATDLGEWAFTEEHYRVAADAYEKAAAFANFAPGDHELALGEARTMEGVAWIAVASAREGVELDRGLGMTGSSIRAVDLHDVYGNAQAALVRAEEALYPLAAQPATEDGLTYAQRRYALARAWRSVINARLTSNDRTQLQEPEVVARVRLAGSGPICPMRVIAEPMPRYPRGAAHQERYGAVVVRVLTTEAGAPRDVRVAASIPEQFQSSVERVAPQWRVERMADAPANCRVQPVIFSTIMFYIE